MQAVVSSQAHVHACSQIQGHKRGSVRMHAQPCPPCLLAQVEGRAAVTEPKRARFTPQQGTSGALNNSATTVLPCLGKKWAGGCGLRLPSPFVFLRVVPLRSYTIVVLHVQAHLTRGHHEHHGGLGWQAARLQQLWASAHQHPHCYRPALPAAATRHTYESVTSASRVALEALTPHVMALPAGTEQQHPMHRCSCRKLAL